MDSGYMGDIIKQLAYDMTSISRATERFTKLEAVSDEDIEALFNRKIDRREDAKYVGLLTAIKKIIHTEDLNGDDCNHLYRNFAYFIANNGKKSAMYEQILMMGIKKIKFQKDDCTYYVLKYAAYYGSDELKAFVENAIKDNDYLKRIYSDYKAEYEKYSKPKKESSMFTISNSEARAFTYANPIEVTVEANHPF